MDPKWIGVAAPIFLLVGLIFIDGGLVWTIFLALMFLIGLVFSHAVLPDWVTGWLLYGWLFLNVIGLIGCLMDLWPHKNENDK